VNPVRASLRYPQVTLVLAAMLFAVGLYTLFTMPRREDPKITIRTGLVSAIYPGATAEETEAQVTRKIEERLFRFSEVRREKTFSTTRNGVVIVNVELNNSVTDADAFWSKLRLDMAQLKSTGLPAGVRGPVVDSDFGDTVAVLIAIHGGPYGYRELKDYAQRVESALRALPAVSKIKRIGDQQETIEITSSQDKLAEYGINPDHVVKALQGRSDVEFAGRLSAGSSKVSVQATSPMQTEEQIRRLLVDVAPTGQPIYMGDVAQVNRLYKDPSEYSRIDSQPTILLAVEMHEGNNIVSFGHDLHRTLDQVQSTLPPDLKLELIADQPRVVGERIGDFFREFGIAIIAVILVTMLLLPMRVALVSAVAIPVTVSITFAMLNAFGIELHQVSISALIVVLGMVVDDAIVIADNYVELLDRHQPVEAAANRCASEMAVPVLTATLTIIASFLPLLWLSGSVGEFIHALPIAIAIALSVSFVVAMLLTPLTARFFIRKGLRDHSKQETHRKPTPLDHMQQQYNRIITWAMANRKSVLLAGLGIFIGGLAILGMVHEQFFPLAERDQFVMDVWLPEGARIEATDAAVKRIEEVLHSEPQVRTFASFIGSSAPRFYYNVSPVPPAANYAQIMVNTRDVKETPKLVHALREKLPDVAPEAKIFVKELQQGQAMEAPIELRIVGDDEATLRTLGDKLQEILRHTPGAIYVNSDWHEDVWQAGLKVDEEIASRLGLTHAAIAQQLAAGFEGAPVATYWEGDRNVDLLLRLDPADRKSFEDLSSAYIMSPVTGAKVPLSAVASLEPQWQPGRIVRRNGVRTLTVRAFPGNGRLASQILSDAKKEMAKMDLPAGYHIEIGGEDANRNETFSEMQRALNISLVLIFLILLFQFRTLADALIVMAAFPLALPGAAFGLFITHNAFGFTAFIGVISLGGLVVRNSIILIDYVHERMKHGVPLEQATLEAGERRLRPIFLTTMAAAVGVTPMILSGSSLWSPLASVIAFGLLGSMFFTLVLIPVLFVAVHTRRAARAQARAAAVTVLLLCAFTLHAEPRKLALDEAIQLANTQNSTVRMADLKVKEAHAKLTQARANYFPIVTNQSNAVHLGELDNLVIPQGLLGTYPSAGPIPGTNASIPLGKQNFFLSTTGAAQPLTQFFKIHSSVSAAQAEAKAAESDAQRARNEVALNAKKLYYNLLSAQRRKEAAELRIQAGEERLKEARNGVEAGAVLELKALEGEAQIADARHSLGVLEDAIADMQTELNDLLGLPLATETALSAPADESPASEPGQVDATVAASFTNALEADALPRNPELAAARLTLNKAHAGLNAARAEFLPDISAFAQHVYQNGVPLLPESSGAFGLRMDWTLSEFGKRTGQIHERRAQFNQAKENLAHTENRLRIDIEKEQRKLRRTESGLEAARLSVKARAEMLRITRNQVEAKTATAAAQKEAEAGLAEAQAQLFQAEAERAIAQAELARTAGRE
jgi:multidrug efflux pump subunit AcrB/outer membrane protein TolC